MVSFSPVSMTHGYPPLAPLKETLTRALMLAAFLAGLTPLQGAAATLTVSNTSATGPGSLQQAMLDANAANGLDMIAFQIPGAGVHTIAPVSALPAITDPVVIDGTTQPGFTGTPLIEINGAFAGLGSDGCRSPRAVAAHGRAVVSRAAPTAAAFVLMGLAADADEDSFVQ